MGLFGKKKDQTKIQEKVPNDAARIFNDEGNAAFIDGDLDKALQKYQAALVLDEKEGDLWGKSANLSNIGIIYISKGETKLGIENLQASHEILKELGLHKDRAILQYHLGWAYSENNAQLSRQAFEESLALSIQENTPIFAERIKLILKALDENGKFSLKIELTFQVNNGKLRFQPSMIVKGMTFSRKENRILCEVKVPGSKTSGAGVR
jgi:tetratricopeptide (TPR) repeat protein